MKKQIQENLKKIEKPTQKNKNKGFGHGGARHGSGRKKFVPTDQERAQVALMSGHGVPYEQIAALVRDGIHIDTLREHFSIELARGKARANSQVGESLFIRAISGDTAAMIWWTKSQMGWREPPKQVEHTGRDGEAIEVESREVVSLKRDELMTELQARGLPTSIFGGDEDT